MPADDLQTLYATAAEHLKVGRLYEAEQLYRNILGMMPMSDAALHGLGLIAYQAGKPSLAVELIQRAVAIQPLPEYLNNLGVVLNEPGDAPAAIQALQLAIRIKPAYPEAHFNLGNSLQKLGDAETAIAEFRQAISLRPTYVEAYANLGSLLRLLGRESEALVVYEECARQNPTSVVALRSLGTARAEQGQLDEAIDYYQRAIQLNPNDPKNHFQLGYTLKAAGLLTEAIACYRRSLELDPTYKEPADDLCFTLIYHPDFDERAIQRELAAWNRTHAPASRSAHTNDRDPERKLRIGYVSPNFRDHVLSLFTIPLLEHHVRERFEIFCYSDAPNFDAISERIRGLSDTWRETRTLSDQSLAEQVRADRIDVLIDITLHMRDNRLRAFALKPAPVQVAWLGYPGSTGLTAMDYRLTDPYLDPPGMDESIYSEKTWRLPHTFWCYDPLTDVPAVNELPALRNGHITFGCLNYAAKINHGVLRVWKQVMRANPQSRLLVLCDPSSHRQRILEMLDIEPGRVEFAARRPRLGYLELFHRVDLCLDTLPYNGHTTTMDGLWMGVPAVTLVGKTLVGRAGLSLLSNVGLPDFIAHSEEQFVHIASETSGDLESLRKLRAGLRQRVTNSPVMDARRFAAGIEQAYRSFWQNWCKGREGR